MSIKQQNDIRKILKGEYTFDTAEQIYKKQEDSLMAMLETVKNESKSRYKTLKQTILPRIALYKVLGEYTTDEERVKMLRHYMIDIVDSKKHASTARLVATKHPGKGQRLLRYNYYKMSVARCLCQF